MYTANPSSPRSPRSPRHRPILRNYVSHLDQAADHEAQVQDNDIFSIQRSIDRPLAVKYPANESSLKKVGVTHSPDVYDRKGIKVKPNPCALTRLPSRVFHESPVKRKANKGDKYPASLGHGPPPGGRAKARARLAGINEDEKTTNQEARYPRTSTPHPHSFVPSDDDDDDTVTAPIKKPLFEHTGYPADDLTSFVNACDDEDDNVFLLGQHEGGSNIAQAQARIASTTDFSRVTGRSSNRVAFRSSRARSRSPASRTPKSARSTWQVESVDDDGCLGGF
ncbi:hypothetical protein NLI96_g11510 [Meripilus lineatus]|uniref:Uncharacterized protein n=1 Tax=Meripilus lineatus TaxID=2056292 RepID=A0AAD5UT72_9APHY|nr:hypothetical protein NLI96_g11510 [Physisporinus lineatus]